MINKVFVNAPERCGSNFLCRFLQENFGLFYVPPVHFLKYIQILTLTDQEQHQLIHDRFCRRLEMFDLKDAAEHYDNFITGNPSIANIIEFYFNDLFQSTIGHIPVFKENEICSYFPLISHSLSNSAIISQLRDPRMMHRSAKDIRPGLFKSKFGSVNQTIRIWQEAEKSIRFVEAGALPIIHFYVNYEELVSEPEKVLQKLDALPQGSFPFHREDHVTRMKKVSETSSARRNLNLKAFNARLKNNSKWYDLVDQHISCQLRNEMNRRGYRSTSINKFSSISLALLFLMSEPFEKLRNKWINTSVKDGSKALYGPNN